MKQNIVLRDYQQDLYNDIVANLEVKRLLVQAETGFGKSILIGHVANNIPGRVLILTHRIELLIQNYEWLQNAAALTSKVNTLRADSRVVIAMVETVHSRIGKYGTSYLGEFDTIICDEIHLDYFKKVYTRFNYKRLIGFTATPLTNKGESKSVDGVEYTRSLTMANDFDKLICGIGTQELIDLGYLTQDYNVALQLPDFDKLRESTTTPDGYTRKSVDEVYNNKAAHHILYEAYEKYGKGKKTIIFNANSTVNKNVYDYLQSKGVECKMYDSVNSSDLSREEIVKWYKDTPDAVLINANVFLVGFNVPEIETCIFNRATKSLALYLQAAGRCARITDKIYKDKFTFVDLGGNIHEHGTWSKKRNWNEYFLPQEWRLKNTLDLLRTWECTFCGAYNPIGEERCEVCFYPKEDAIVVKDNNKRDKVGKFIAVNDMPLPRANNIIQYCLKNDKNSSFAFKLLEQRIIELFIHYNVSRSFYIAKRTEFQNRIEKIFKPIYMAIIKNKFLTGPRRRFDTQLNKIFKTIDKLYQYESN